MLIKEISFIFAGNIISLFFSLGSIVVIARVLGPEKQGLFALALLIPTILSGFCCFGFEYVNTTFAGLYKNQRKSMFFHTLLVGVIGGCVCAIIVSTYFFWLPIDKGEFERLSSETIGLAILFACTTMMWSMLNAFLRGIEKIVISAMLQIAFGVLLFLFVVLVVWLLDGQVEGAILAYSLASLTATFFVIWHLREYVTVNPSYFSKELFIRSFSFGWRIAFATFTGFLLSRLGQGILAYMVPSGAVGLYAVAVSLTERLKLLPSSVAGAFLPRLANDLPNRQQQVPQMFRCMLIISFFLMLMLGAAGVPGIYLFFGKAYIGSIIPFLILLPGTAALGGSGILSSYLLARRKPGYAIVIGFVILGLNVILNLCLIPFLGINGSAIANSSALIFSALMWMIYYRRESGVPIKELCVKYDDFKLLCNAAKKSLKNRFFSNQVGENAP